MPRFYTGVYTREFEQPTAPTLAQGTENADRSVTVSVRASQAPHKPTKSATMATWQLSILHLAISTNQGRGTCMRLPGHPPRTPDCGGAAARTSIHMQCPVDERGDQVFSYVNPVRL